MEGKLMSVWQLKRKRKWMWKIRNAGGGSYNLSSLAVIQRSVMWVCLHFRAQKCIDLPLLTHICKRPEHDCSICFPSRWLDRYAHSDMQYRQLYTCVVLHLHCTKFPQSYRQEGSNYTDTFAKRRLYQALLAPLTRCMCVFVCVCVRRRCIREPFFLHLGAL